MISVLWDAMIRVGLFDPVSNGLTVFFRLARFVLVFACEVQKKVRYSTCARRNNFYGLPYDNHLPRRRRRPPLALFPGVQ